MANSTNKNTITNSTLHIGGNLHVGDIIYNIKEDLQNTILFLRIQKEETKAGISYKAHLEIKAQKLEQIAHPITESIELNLKEVFFKALHNFQLFRRNQQAHIFTRQDLDGQILLEKGEGSNNQNVQWEQQLGVGLYDRFLPPESELRTVVQYFFKLLAQRKIENLSLVISSPDAEILNVPLEMMRETVNTQPLTLSHDNFMLVHSLEENLLDFEVSIFQPIALPLRILFVTALPNDLEEDEKFIDLEREQERLIEILGDLPSQKKVMVEFLEIGSLEGIERALREGQHHILHISGHGLQVENEHGEQIGLLCLEDEEGNQKMVEGKRLAKLLKGLSSLKMVVLSACQTGRAEEFGIAGALLRAGIPAVLGMHYSIGDAAATLFTATFYEHLCQGQTLSQAVFYARQAVAAREAKMRQQSAILPSISEWFTPFLYLNQYMGQWINPNAPITESQYFFKHFRSGQFFSGIKSIRMKSSGRIKVDNDPAKLVGQGFVGRRKQLATLTNLFLKNTRAICIHGIGGIGKTSLAARFLDNYFNKGFQILLFEGEITEHQILTEIAEKTPEAEREQLRKIINDPNKKPEQKRRLILSSLQQTILFFDNFEDNQIEPKSADLEEQKALKPNAIRSEALQDFLLDLVDQLAEMPESQKVFVLFTTRYFPIQGLLLHGEDLNKLSFPDTYKLISRLPKLIELSLKERRAVHERLGGHPRALELLHSYLRNETSVTWETIESKFEPTEQYLVKHDLLLEMLWELLTEEEQYVLSVASIFRNLTARESLVKVSELPLEMVSSALKRLQKISLVYLEKDKFWVHRLTSGWVLSKAEEDVKKYLHYRAAQLFDDYTVIVKTYSAKEGNFLQMLESYWHYTNAELYNDAASVGIDLQRFYNNLGFAAAALGLGFEITEKEIESYYQNLVAISNASIMIGIGRFSEAEKMLKDCLVNGEIENDDEIIAGAASELSHLYVTKGAFQEALVYTERSLLIEQAAENLAGIQVDYQQLGAIYTELEDYEKAYKYLELSKNIAEDRGDISSVAYTIHEIGVLKYLSGDSEAALSFFETSLPRLIQLNIPKAIAATCYQIGELKNGLGLPESAQFLEKALNIQKRIGDKSGEALTLTALAEIEATKEHLTKAFDLYHQSLNLSIEIGHTQNQAVNHSRLGKLNFDCGQNYKAIEHLNKGIDLHQSLGDDKGVALGYYNIGNAYMNLNEKEAALNHLDKAIELAHQYADTFIISWGEYTKGLVFINSGETEKAVENFKETLKYNASLEEEDIELTTACHFELAEGYIASNNLIESESHYNRTIELASTHQLLSYLIDAYSGIALIYEKQENWEKVISKFMDTIPLLEELQDKKSVATNYEIIGDMYQNLDKLNLACSFYEKSHQIFKDIDAVAASNVRKEIESVTKLLGMGGADEDE